MSREEEDKEQMDKLKKVLSGQDDGSPDGGGILEVTAANCWVLLAC